MDKEFKESPKIWILIIPIVCLLVYVFIYSFANKKENDMMIDRYYGISSKNRNTLYDYCKSIPKPENDGPIISVSLQYTSHFKKYSGLTFKLDIKDCESLPNESVCLDSNNCFIRYRDEDYKYSEPY